MSERPRLVPFDLRGLAPTPERMLHLLRLWLESAPGGIALDWGTLFPWSVDERLRVDAAPQSLVSEVDRRCSEAGVSLWYVIRAVLPDPYYATNAYSRLARASRDGAVDATVSSLVEDVYQDITSLLPSLTGILFAGHPDRACVARTHWRPIVADDGRSWVDATTPAQLSPAVRLSETDDFFEPTGALTGTVEVRAVRLGFLPSGRTDLSHRHLMDARERLWNHIALVHESLANCEHQAFQAGIDLVDSFAELQSLWRAFGGALREVRHHYATKSSSKELDRFARVTGAAPREQMALLHARFSRFRASR